MFNNSLIGRFKIILSWVAAKSGKTYVEYDEKGTTRTCHNCGYIFESGLAPNIRKWRCPQCEIEHIRDENSAQNGLRLVLRDLSQKEGMDVPVVPGSGLVRVSERWAWRVLPSGVETLRGGKNSVQTQRQEIKTESMVAFDQKLVTCQL
jgi:putative transposase